MILRTLRCSIRGGPRNAGVSPASREGILPSSDCRIVGGLVAIALMVPLLLSAALWAAPPATKPAASQPAQEWKLPGVGAVHAGTLRVSRDGKIAIFEAPIAPNAATAPADSVLLTYWLLHTDTGRLQDLARFLPPQMRTAESLLAFAEPSPDGRFVAIGAGTLLPAPSFTAFIVDLAGGQAKPVAQGTMLQARWAGGKLAVARLDKQRKFERLLLADPNGSAAELPIRGWLSCADAAGGKLLVGCDPNSPDAPLGLADTSRQRLAIVVDGNIVRTLPQAAHIETPAMISENGGIIASPGHASVAIFPADGNARILAVTDVPLAVWDDGMIAAASDDDGTAVRLWSTYPPSPNHLLPAVNVVADAVAAAPAAHRLFYIARGEAPTLAAVPLPPTPATAPAEDEDTLPRRSDEDKRVVPEPGD